MPRKSEVLLGDRVLSAWRLQGGQTAFRSTRTARSTLPKEEDTESEL